MARRDVDVRVSGPVFDGRADLALHDYKEQVAEEVAQDAEDRVKANLHMTLRHPTGYYESHVQAIQVSELHHQVTDMGVIYGPWLEGTGERNRTTRFKGYANWRRSLAETEVSSGETAERLLPPYVSRME